MKNFRFNKIIVLESLKDNERHTGKELYDDLISRMPYIHTKLKVEYYDIDTLAQWDVVMDDILGDCLQNHNIPIIHFEIHGESNGKGLVIKNHELATLEHVGAQLRNINIATGCNLFITLGVCKGLYLLFNMIMNEPMPFIGAVGSFSNLKNDDIYIRFYDFYDTLFSSMDIGKAFTALQHANPDMPAEYRYIPADELFYKNYHLYLKEQCTKVALGRRAKESIGELKKQKPMNRRERRMKEKEFIAMEKKSREKYFREHSSKFFMLSEYPDNKDRFNVPSTFKELKDRYDRLVTL